MSYLWELVSDTLRNKGFGTINATTHSLYTVTPLQLDISDPRSKGTKNRSVCKRLGADNDEDEIDMSEQIFDNVFYDDDNNEIATIAVLSKDLKETSIGRTVTGSSLHHEQMVAGSVRNYVAKNNLCFSICSMAEMSHTIQRNFHFTGTRPQKERGLAKLVEMVSAAATEGLRVPSTVETIYMRSVFFFWCRNNND